ncbi:BACON domain-containing protein [uncultured Alistipes sp.]|jgi:hypothetical protein|uniref:BACON domain-containing protein n=1 Tax=uncultured Alistipes sp. TaxID=538949 RepID=UPI0025F04A60|nr:BACON domain-containing protein [uncultured Alistipes sp.]
MAITICSCSDKGEDVKSTLTITPTLSAVEFSADGRKAYNLGQEITPTFSVSTNQSTWSAESNKSWCSVTENKSAKTFTISALANTSETAPEAATVTVKTQGIAPITITVTQAAFEGEDYLSIDPVLSAIEFSADGAKAFDGDNEVTPTFTVATNQSTWSAESNKTWCTVTENKSAGTFTISAAANTSTTAPEAATVTIKAGEMEPVTIAVTQRAAAPATEYDVYVVGDEEISNSQWVTRLWKNGVGSTISSGENYSTPPHSVYVSGNDVYIAGEAYYDNDRRGFIYWRNGVAHYASSQISGVVETVGASIFVVGSDVYVAGSESNENQQVAKLWKNGAPQYTGGKLSSNDDAHATSVFVSGSDVYVAGFEYKGDHTVAKLWKNGVAQYTGGFLTDGSKDSRATSVYVSGNDVYVAGYERTNGDYKVAKLWKNGVAQYAGGVLESNFSEAESVFVSNGDVYVAGTETFDYGGDNESGFAKLWKNGVAQYTNGRLTDGTHPAQGLSVYAIDGDVYVAGLEMRDIGNDQRMESAKLWKNGVAQYGGDLGDGVNFAVARSVFVVAR